MTSIGRAVLAIALVVALPALIFAKATAAGQSRAGTPPAHRH